MESLLETHHQSLLVACTDSARQEDKDSACNCVAIQTE